MGIRGHIQTTQAEYKGKCISSWVSKQYRTFLEKREIYIHECEDGYTWEIYIDDNLRKLTKELLAGEHEDELKSLFSVDIFRESYSKELGGFLDEGIRVGDARNYDYIIIDFF